MVGGLGTYFTDAHYFVSRDANRVDESVNIPGLKQGNIQADVSWVEAPVLDDAFEETGQVFDVVHYWKLEVRSGRLEVGSWKFGLIGINYLNNVGSADTLFLFSSFSMSVLS